MAYVLPTSGSQGQRKPRSEEDAAFGGAPALTTANTLAPASAPAQQTTFASAKRVADANLGADQSASTDRLLTPAKQEAVGMNTNLDLQGTNYTKTAQAAADKQYKDQDWMGIANKAVSGFGTDQADAYGKVKQTVQGRDLPVTAFKAAPMQGLESGANLALGNVAGTLKQNAGSNYSGGMAALDASLMKRTGGIQNLQGQVGTLQEGVNANRANLESTLGKGAQGYLDTQKAGASNAYQDALRNISSGITSGAQQRFTDGQAKDAAALAQNRAGFDANFADRVAQAQKSIVRDPFGISSEQNDAFNKLGALNNNGVIERTGRDRQLSDEYTQDDSTKYNRALSLLEQDPTKVASGAMAPTSFAGTGWQYKGGGADLDELLNGIVNPVNESTQARFKASQEAQAAQEREAQRQATIQAMQRQSAIQFQEPDQSIFTPVPQGIGSDGHTDGAAAAAERARRGSLASFIGSYAQNQPAFA